VPAESGGANRARRAALWQLGIAAPGEDRPMGTQLALPFDVPAPPELRRLEPWESMVADYATTGLTLGAHPLALLRERLPAGAVSCRDLERMRHKDPVRIGGLVVARQRPGTAKGIVFLLLEDEFGTINLIVPPDVYEKHRLIVRAEPLLLADGRLEKLPIAGGAINVFVHALQALVTPEDVQSDDEASDRGRMAGIVELAERRAAAAAVEAPAAREAAAADPSTILADFRGVAPAVQSFASGRRR
jgi:error-prone DNA polymerase